MSYRLCILLVFFLVTFLPNQLWAQKKNDAFRLTIKKARQPLLIDGRSDEADWQQAQVAGKFFMVLPMDTSVAELRTEVRMTYDDQNIYIFAECFHGGWDYMVESLRRDWNFIKNDNFIFFLDTYDDQTNGFAFGANAAGAQWDGMM